MPESAIYGEQGAYVPCLEEPASLPASEQGAIVGADVGYVARNAEAAAEPTGELGAIVGSGVGFVPGPCGCLWSAFDVVTVAGWGETAFGDTWGLATSDPAGTTVFSAGGAAVITPTADARSGGYANLFAGVWIDSSTYDPVPPVDVSFSVRFVGAVDAGTYLEFGFINNYVDVTPDADNVNIDGVSDAAAALDWTTAFSVRMQYDVTDTFKVKVWQGVEPVGWLLEDALGSPADVSGFYIDLHPGALIPGLELGPITIQVDGFDLGTCSTIVDETTTVTRACDINTGDSWRYQWNYSTGALWDHAISGQPLHEKQEGFLIAGIPQPTPPDDGTYRREFIAYDMRTDADIISIDAAFYRAWSTVWTQESADFDESQDVVVERGTWGGSQPGGANVAYGGLVSRSLVDNYHGQSPEPTPYPVLETLDLAQPWGTEIQIAPHLVAASFDVNTSAQYFLGTGTLDTGDPDYGITTGVFNDLTVSTGRKILTG